MQYFQTDEDGYLIGSGTADASPLEPGVFLLPHGGVTANPPALGANQCARFVNGAWVIEPDYRGVTYWLPDRTSKTISARGVALPVGALLSDPGPTLAQAKAAKLAALMASRDAACTANVVVQGKTFEASPNVQTGIKRLADRMRRGRPTTLQAILDASGNPVSPITQALLDGIEDAIAANTEAAWNHYGALVAQVNAATDAATVNAVVW